MTLLKTLTIGGSNLDMEVQVVGPNALAGSPKLNRSGQANGSIAFMLLVMICLHDLSAAGATALSFSMCCLTHALDHLRPTLGVVLSCGSELCNCETNDRTVTSDLLNQRQRRVHGHSVWLGIGEVRKL